VGSQGIPRVPLVAKEASQLTLASPNTNSSSSKATMKKRNQLLKNKKSIKMNYTNLLSTKIQESKTEPMVTTMWDNIKMISRLKAVS
jgi:hypothetical protein